jgi:hypothetical protein
MSSVVVFALLAGVVGAQGHHYSLKITNASKYDIYHLYLTSSDDRHWGPDQLRDDIIGSDGGSFTLTGLQTAEYDVKFVDEDGDDCVLQNIQITGDTSWTLTTDWLVRCEFHQHGAN